MTIAFDAIWIPITISGLGLAWAVLMLRNFGSYGIIEELTVGLLFPLIPVLLAWLIWALLT